MRATRWRATAAAAVLALSFLCLTAHAQEPTLTPAPQPAVAPAPVVRIDIAIAVGLSIGLPCMAAGYAVGRVGAAALGAAAERPELLGRSLILVALGEGIAVFGAVIAMLILFVRF